MSEEIQVAQRRPETHIERLCKTILMFPKAYGLESADGTTLVDLCSKIQTAAVDDANAIHREANFAVNKLSEALERTTRMMEQMAKPIKLETEGLVNSIQNILKEPAPGPNDDDKDYGSRFFVVGGSDDFKWVTRSKNMRTHGHPLTRKELYERRWEEAECEYAHSFMCGGFPTKPDPARPTKEEWLAKEPFKYEVDKFISEKLFPEAKHP